MTQENLTKPLNGAIMDVILSNTDDILTAGIEVAADIAVSTGCQNGGLVLGFFDDEEDLITFSRKFGNGVREPDPEGRGPDDKGGNYISIAFSKILECIETGRNSGDDPDRPLRKGEYGYPGGIVIQTARGCLYIAYSGFPKGEDDKRVAWACVWRIHTLCAELCDELDVIIVELGENGEEKL
ncbi:MAG: hypothetical protein LBG75_03150 [Candidatus Nomurabacteria bacterium]|jgi:hypothetical protein|nr:hypothetical protein [Candidatus Nomurabacteria bacterium]